MPAEPDVVSIDVDGNDWWIWRALVAYRPRLLVIEYNGNLDPASLLVKPYEPTAEWDLTSWFGASLGAYEWLAATKGYTLVHTDLRGVNAFFLRDDLLPAFGPVAPPRRVANYDLLGAHMAAHPGDRPWVDLAVDPPGLTADVRAAQASSSSRSGGVVAEDLAVEADRRVEVGRADHAEAGRHVEQQPVVVGGQRAHARGVGDDAATSGTCRLPRGGA